MSIRTGKHTSEDCVSLHTITALPAGVLGARGRAAWAVAVGVRAGVWAGVLGVGGGMTAPAAAAAAS